MDSNIDAYSEDFDITLNIDGIKHIVGVKITNKGTITVNTEEEWHTDPPEQPHVSAGFFLTDYEIEEMPEWEITWIWVYEGGNNRPIEMEGEGVNDYFILNPEKRKLIDQDIILTLKDFADESAQQMQSIFAFDVIINESGNDYDDYEKRDN
jgi:hypothetical protein